MTSHPPYDFGRSPLGARPEEHRDYCFIHTNKTANAKKSEESLAAIALIKGKFSREIVSYGCDVELRDTES